MKTENDMTLLTDFREGEDNPTGWLMTEKFRGCRAYWDGTFFWTREGNRIPAPAEVTIRMPFNTPLDGEIWAGHTPTEERARKAVRYGGRFWDEEITFAVFDSPSTRGNWLRRISFAKAITTFCEPNRVFVAASIPCNGIGHLRSELLRILEHGGEGIVLRHPTATGYETGRTRNALRVTPLTLNIL